MPPTLAVPRQGPSLLFDAADLPRLRQRFNHPDCRPLWQRVLTHCDLMLTDSPPVLCRRHVRITHLALAALIEERDDYAGVAIKRTLTTCDTAPPAPDRTSLGTGGIVSQLGLVYDWLGEQMTATQRQQIHDTLQTQGFDPQRREHAASANAIPMDNCNGAGVVSGPLLMAAILLNDAMDTRHAFTLALNAVRRTIDAFCPDGGYQEGPLYWNYYTRHLLFGVEALRRIRGIDLYTQPFLRYTADYILHHILPDITHCANTADSTDHTHLWPAMARLAAQYREPRWQWLARRMARHAWPDNDGETLEYAPFFLLWYDPELPADAPTPEDRTRLFQGLQLLSWRSDWTPQAHHVLWLNGPSNCHHNHLHLNSFTFTVGSHRLLRECGQFDYANYQDYRRGTAGHNTLLADGEGQAITLDDTYWCQRLRAGEWGTVYGWFEGSREECDSPIATGVTRNAYPGRLTRFDRTLAFVERRFLFMHDDLTPAKTPLYLTWLFHGDRAIEIMPDGATFHAGPLAMRLIVHCRLPLRFRVHHDHCLLRHDNGKANDKPGPTLPRLEIEAETTDDSTIDLYALMVPLESDIRCRLTEHADGMLFDVDTRQWIYERRTRSLRRASDTPLPRRIV